MTLDRFCIATTNETWNETFVTRDIDSKEKKAIHKMISVENVALYWTTVCRPLSQIIAHENFDNSLLWDSHMKSLVYRKSASSAQKETLLQMQQYLLLPPNMCSLKVIHRENHVDASAALPKIEITAEGLNLNLRLDRTQILQYNATSNTFRYLERQKLIALCRPDQRPSSGASARKWWHYAYMLVTGKTRSWNVSSVDEAIACFRMRDRYISLVKSSKKKVHY